MSCLSDESFMEKIFEIEFGSQAGIISKICRNIYPCLLFQAAAETSTNSEVEMNSRNLWLDTLDDDCLSSEYDEDQNDLEIVSHGKI